MGLFWGEGLAILEKSVVYVRERSLNVMEVRIEACIPLHNKRSIEIKSLACV